MYKIHINSRWCKGCGLCVSFCPRNIYDFSWGNVPVAARSDDCVGCMQCELKCPDFAVTVKEDIA